MPRIAAKIECTEEELRYLKKLISSHTTEKRLVERAKIILRCNEGQRTDQIAEALDTRPNTVAKWRNRFCKARVDGLKDATRSGKPKKYTEKDRNAVAYSTEDEQRFQGKVNGVKS